jgi:hypothetical protein
MASDEPKHRKQNQLAPQTIHLRKGLASFGFAIVVIAHYGKIDKRKNRNGNRCEKNRRQKDSGDSPATDQNDPNPPRVLYDR